MTVACFCGTSHPVFFALLYNCCRVTCRILREKLRMKNVERLFKVSKSAWGAFVFISFHPTDAFGSFSIMRLGWRHWHFSFFAFKKHRKPVSWVPFLPEINRRINEMQSKMKVSFSETRETFMKRFCFPGHVLNCLLSADNAMHREGWECKYWILYSEWSFRIGLWRTFHFSLNVPGSLLIISNYALSFPL